MRLNAPPRRFFDMKAKYPGKCARCKESFPKGSDIRYFPQSGVWPSYALCGECAGLNDSADLADRSYTETGGRSDCLYDS